MKTCQKIVLCIWHEIWIRVKQFAFIWFDERKLIFDIWAGRFPKSPRKKLSIVEKSVMTILIILRSISFSFFHGFFIKEDNQTHFTDAYVITWFMALFILLFFPFPSYYYIIIIAYRLIDCFSYQIFLIFKNRYTGEWNLVSFNRSLILLFINYFELIVGFAALHLYFDSLSPKGGSIGGPWDAVYFSIVTITTLGYGDITPSNSMVKVLVSTETIIGVIFLVLVVSTLINGIPELSRSID